MQWVHSSVQLVEDIDASTLLRKVEKACRTCYRSENLIGEGTAEKLIRSCIARGHESVLEHASISYRVVCDRGVSHEWVRHRIASYSQESTRYCNYTNDKFDNQLTFIYPAWPEKEEATDTEQLVMYNLYHECKNIEQTYAELIHLGATPDVARAILPNCIKTEFICTMNIRELRNFIKLRATKFAHADIRKLAIELLHLLRQNGLGVFFEDIEIYEE